MKKLTALSLSGVSFFILASPAFAAAADTIPINTCAGDQFSTLCNLAGGNIATLITAIITILFIVSAIIALAFLIFGGIKWITSGGDKAKVEEARGTIVAALVGLVLVFLAYFILNIIFKFFGLTSVTSFNLPNIGVLP